MNTRPSRSLVPALVWGAAVPTVLWVVLFVWLVLVLPGYKSTFSAFGMQLPASTLFAVELADWVTTYWYVLLLFLPTLLVSDVIVLVLLQRLPSRVPSYLWCALMIALALLATALVIVAIYLPLAKLQEGLSK